MSQISRDADPVSLWASARVSELLDGQGDPPKYGNREWQELPNGDPRKAAAMITAAEMWRRYGDEQELMTWFRDAYRNREPLAGRRTLAELDALARLKPAKPVQATPGWPPIALPGRPGWYRCHVDGRQVDVQRTDVAA
ncbi:hypothetical protein [Streptomyces stelliscabiei]|uniref:Uncharacterized protein n=1 Tax=Streptomyces stelliscabiei TaxID=146820 RepID=A0A8I0TUZ4_9ACTN|nr:hypothetical protein [Streptomyces stelliscabiei]MBE1601297.1 hypothetical protein [Streptomyces stelliscabiei]